MIGLVLIGLVFLLNYYGATLWSSVILLVSILSFQEFKSMCEKMEIYPQSRWIYFFITAFVLLPLLVADRYSINFVFIYSMSLIIAAYAIIFPRILLKPSFTKFDDVTSSLWAIFHMGLLPSLYTWIRIMDKGFYYTLIIILAISASDTGSLIFGKLFGRTQLAPTISPGKTVTGSIAGLLCGAAAFLGFCRLFHVDLNPNFWVDTIDFLKTYYPSLDKDYESFSSLIIFALGLLLTIVAQIGDLLVSALKRGAGVKDSGNLLMAHGGVLDRVDSHIFAVWFAFFVFAYLLV